MTASCRCLSAAVLNPYQALEAYNSLAMITDRYTTCRVVLDMPWHVECTSTVCAHEQATFVTALTDFSAPSHQVKSGEVCWSRIHWKQVSRHQQIQPLPPLPGIIRFPYTFAYGKRIIPGSGGSGWICWCHLFSVNMTSTDFAWFNSMLLTLDPASTLLSFWNRMSMLLDGTIKYVSPAYLHRKFPSMMASKSVAVRRW